MPHPVLMPRPGQMTEECTLLVWHKDEGDRVAKGDVLFEIETDKAVMEVEAFDEGVLLRRVVGEGETVPVNAVCGWVGAPGEVVPDQPPAAPPQTSVDVPDAAPVVEPTPSVVDSPREPAASPPRMSPRARRRARELGVDAADVSGSGPGGRIVERDVEAAARAAPREPARPEPSIAPGVKHDADEELVPMSRMRRVIAERLTQSAAVPQFSATVAVDVTSLMRLRSELAAAGSAVTVTDAVMMAAAETLVEMPLVNSRTDGEVVWLRRRVHLGLAVSVPGGLVVPVIRDADHLTLSEIHERASALIGDARSGSLPPDAMTGSTFTVSNLGMLNVEEFTAIINPGESAILAVGRATPTPVVIGGGIGIRTLMRMTLTADHRLIDGELAARFLDAVRRRLEDPHSLDRKAIDL